MLQESLSQLLTRDLNKLKEELTLYKDETHIWELRPGIANTAGNLALHLVGNLNHFIGATLGNTGYVRKRDDEFGLKNVPRTQILSDIDKTIEVVKTTLPKLTAADLEKEFPHELGGRKLSTEFALMVFFAHFSYHLGQINYHRRLIEGA